MAKDFWCLKCKFYQNDCLQSVHEHVMLPYDFFLMVMALNFHHMLNVVVEDTDDEMLNMKNLEDLCYYYFVLFLVLEVSSTHEKKGISLIYSMLFIEKKQQNKSKFIKFITLCVIFCELDVCLSGCGEGSSHRVACAEWCEITDGSNPAPVGFIYWNPGPYGWYGYGELNGLCCV